jgi:cytochrome c553
MSALDLLERPRSAKSATASTDLRKAPSAESGGGQTEDYLVEPMTAFKSGECGHEMMSVVVQSLSPTDIEDLAAYYSAIEISVGKLPAQ